jgi:folylpolyglutamate synthase/dihydropteroate synthase
VFGAMRDKNVAAMIALLAPHASHLILTEPPNPRRATVAALADTAQSAAPAIPVELEPDPGAALDRAWEHGSLVVVAGSIFLVGDLMARLSPNSLH